MSASVQSPLTTIRMIVTTTDGKKSEAYVSISTSSSGQDGWRSIAFPLPAITGFDKTNKTIKSIAISGDSLASIFVGEVKMINDTTPIRGEFVGQTTMNLALGDEITLRAYGSGGASVLKYSWDFDNKDGIQVDAEGPVIVRKFRKAGTYVITLTVSDAYGLKTPYTTTITAKVNP